MSTARRIALLAALTLVAAAARRDTALPPADRRRVHGAQRSDTVRARVELIIGDESPAAPHGFGAISGIALDREGRIYASDLQEAHVVVFAPTGKLLTTIGRKGRGPGEFEGPSGPAIGADGALYVRDIAKVARFIPDPVAG